MILLRNKKEQIINTCDIMLSKRSQEFILYDSIHIKFKKVQAKLVWEVESSAVRGWEERGGWITKVDDKTFEGDNVILIAVMVSQL